MNYFSLMLGWFFVQMKESPLAKLESDVDEVKTNIADIAEYIQSAVPVNVAGGAMQQHMAAGANSPSAKQLFSPLMRGHVLARILSGRRSTLSLEAETDPIQVLAGHLSGSM